MHSVTTMTMYWTSVETFKELTTTDNKMLPLTSSSNCASTRTVLLNNKPAITRGDAVNNYIHNQPTHTYTWTSKLYSSHTDDVAHGKCCLHNSTGHSILSIINSCWCVGVCNTGEIRLVGGPNDHEGRVEVCKDHVWGTICSQLWGDVDAKVVCKQLGHSDSCELTNLYFSA